MDRALKMVYKVVMATTLRQRELVVLPRFFFKKAPWDADKCGDTDSRDATILDGTSAKREVAAECI